MSSGTPMTWIRRVGKACIPLVVERVDAEGSLIGVVMLEFSEPGFGPLPIVGGRGDWIVAGGCPVVTGE
jgi:hypothetical protein